MPTSTRRTHRKSRLGCQQCKKNRTKCDEKRPSCSRCTRIGAECSLIDPTSTLFLVNKSSEKAQSRPQKSASPNPIVEPTVASSSSAPSVVISSEPPVKHNTPPADLPNYSLEISKDELYRLRLMNHYLQSTAKSIGDLTFGTPEGLSLWQNAVPKLALEHDVLLHCLLSISALHIALSNADSQNEHRILAVQHHNHSIALCTPLLTKVTADNVDALFGFACLTALYSFGIHLKGRSQLTPLVKIHEVFTMIRGTSIIVQNGIQWLTAGTWASWFRKPEIDTSKPIRSDVEAAITGLRERIDTTITTSSQSEMYHATINGLRENFVQALAIPRPQMALVMFPIFAPPEYLQMVCIGEPLALAILANWGIILHWIRNHIWLQDWGSKTVRAVHEVLPSEWQSCISWALQEIEGSQEPTQLPTPNEVEFTTRPVDNSRTRVLSTSDLLN